ncbi:acyl-CoA dehydrogenase [soil metagenome]
MSTAELTEIRGLARDFAAAELRPHTERWDADCAVDDDVLSKLAELGFLGMLVPESAGGMGMDLPTFLAALEELAWGEAGVAFLVAQSVTAADTIARLGGDAARSRLEPLAAGAETACLALAEDGTDVSALGTRAERRGDGWVVTGTKAWVTNGDADTAVVLADTEDGPALFTVGRDGRTASERVATLGLRTAPILTVQFDEAPAERLGAVAGEHSVGDPVGVLAAAAIAVGIAQAALDHAVAYAAEREQFGRPLRSFEGIQHKLAEMATKTAAARALVERAATRPDDGAAAAMAKLAAGTCAMFVTTEAVQIFGGSGSTRDYPIKKTMRDAKAMEIVHGTSDVQRLRIAASLYSD